MDAAWYRALTVAVTQLFLGGYVMLLVEFRHPVKTWRTRWLVLAGGLVALHVALIELGLFSFYSRFAVVTLVLPYGMATVWCSRYRGARTVFSVANGIYVGCICGVNGYLVQALFPAVMFLPLLVRVISLVSLYFVLKRFGQICRQMLRQLDHGWTVLCLIPITTGLLTLYVYHQYFQADPFRAAIILYGLLILCGCAYYLMFLFFERARKETEAHHVAQLSAFQLSALQSRMEAVKAVESAIGRERHDLRHRLQTVAELVARGDKKTALDFLADANQRLDSQREIRWCRPPVLDAMFSSYFEQAKSQEIRVKAELSFPDKLPVNEGELAIVLANALENAIHANLKLPSDQREIRCKTVGSPGLMLEISNPCNEPVLFDAKGLPLAHREGHGLGAQSISAFCQKHGAVCHFEQSNGRFQMQLVL
ncbi:MAG TPA: GHKL domain-containing protein [Candidatus Limiplasma stercoravium]|nr:GHKL domain-containing protein [Candidatus Limiplasma stercoravium]